MVLIVIIDVKFIERRRIRIFNKQRERRKRINREQKKVNGIRRVVVELEGKRFWWMRTRTTTWNAYQQEIFTIIRTNKKSICPLSTMSSSDETCLFLYVRIFFSFFLFYSDRHIECITEDISLSVTSIFTYFVDRLFSLTSLSTNFYL